MSEDKDKCAYVYMLRCADNSLYCGWTYDLDARIKAHSEGRGAKYTRGRTPVVFAYVQSCSTKSEAMACEARLKKLTKNAKEALCVEWAKQIT